MWELYEKYKSIGWGLFLILGTMFSVLFCVVTKATMKEYTVDATKVSEVHIHVKTELLPAYYGETKEFVVRDKKNIELMVEALEEKHVFGKEDATGEVMRFSICYMYKNGTSEEYQLEYVGVPAESYMGRVFCSEEVIKQTRTAFTMDVDKVGVVELFHYKDSGEKEPVTECIKDRKLMNQILDLAKEDTRIRPVGSLEATKCGVLFKDKSRKVLLAVNISKDMTGYDQLVKKIPVIAKYVA